MSLASSFGRDRPLWLTGLVSACLLVYMNVHDAVQFASLTNGRDFPGSDLSATPESILALRDLLIARPDAAAVMHTLHLYPDMVLPAALTAFLVLLIRRLSAGALIYRRRAETLLPILLTIPLLYGVFDYTENTLCFLLFPPASPAPENLQQLAQGLYWATRLKFLFVTISFLLAARLALAHTRFGHYGEKD